MVAAGVEPAALMLCTGVPHEPNATSSPPYAITSSIASAKTPIYLSEKTHRAGRKRWLTAAGSDVQLRANMCFHDLSYTPQKAQKEQICLKKGCVNDPDASRSIIRDKLSLPLLILVSRSVRRDTGENTYES